MWTHVVSLFQKKKNEKKEKEKETPIKEATFFLAWWAQQDPAQSHNNLHGRKLYGWGKNHVLHHPISDCYISILLKI